MGHGTQCGESVSATTVPRNPLDSTEEVEAQSSKTLHIPDRKNTRMPTHKAMLVPHASRRPRVIPDATRRGHWNCCARPRFSRRDAPWSLELLRKAERFQTPRAVATGTAAQGRASRRHAPWPLELPRRTERFQTPRVVAIGTATQDRALPENTRCSHENPCAGPRDSRHYTP